jgi:hypothetical protein
LVTVSAYNTDVSIDRKGLLQRPILSGNDFVARGISVDPARFSAISPERAVERVARLTGARISRAPELVLPGKEYHPTGALWKLTLDRDVRVHGVDKGRQVQVREIFTGPTNKLFIPAGTQPSIERTFGLVGPPWDDRTAPVELPVKAGHTAVFEQATPAPAGR